MDREKSWKKKGDSTDFPSYVYDKTSKTIADLTAPKDYICPQIPEAARMLKEAVAAERPITVIVDYDADGIDSGALIYMILRELGAKKTRIVVPKRMKDGYGINERMVSEIEDGAFLMTIDNGIAAVEPFKAAKARNMTILVLDHHQAQEVIPQADLIVDPEAFPEGWTFDGYCGAGLTFKLAEYLFPDKPDLLDVMSCFAAIATIGDSVNVTEDNRRIVLRGLRNLNRGKCTPGLAAIMRVLKTRDKIEHYSVYELAFKIAPMFNAPGRLYDDGGKDVLSCLFSSGDAAEEKANTIYEQNEKRKEMVAEAAQDTHMRGEKTAFLYNPELIEGICGIIAGRLSNDLHRPAFVMTDAAEPGIVKGSARCEDDYNVFEMMQKADAKGLFTRFGGHQCAAGFSLEKKNLDELFQTLEDNVGSGNSEAILYYDLDVADTDLLNLYILMKQIEIFGVGLEKPVIRVKAVIQDAKAIGGDGTHLRCMVNNIPAIGFSMYEKYKELGEPQTAILYGTMETNWFRGRESAQLQIVDIESE